MEKKEYLQFRSRHNLNNLEKPSWLLYFSIDLALIGLCAWAWTVPNFGGLFSAVLIASLMFRNFSMMHEAVHGLCSDNRKINSVIGIWTGALCLLPFAQWRKVHLEHHFWAGNVEKDPVMALLILFPKLSSPVQKTLSFLWQCWVPIMAFLQYAVFWYHCSAQLLSQKKNPEFVLSLLAPLVVYPALFYFTSPSFVMQAILPGFFIYFVAVEVVNFPHHLELPHEQGETKIHVWNQNTISRSCVYPKWFARLFVLNFNYHTEHHLFPDVPWSSLDHVSDLLKADQIEGYNEDVSHSWILRSRTKSLGLVLATAEKAPQSQRAA